MQVPPFDKVYTHNLQSRSWLLDHPACNAESCGSTACWAHLQVGAATLNRTVQSHICGLTGILCMRRGPVKSAAQFIAAHNGNKVGQCTSSASPVTAFGG